MNRRVKLAIDIIALVSVLLLGVWAWDKIETPVSPSPALAERWGYYSFSDYSIRLGGERFYEEGLHRFLAEEYAGDYEAELIAEFQRFMPETPPWKR